MERVTRQQEEMDKVIRQKEDEIKEAQEVLKEHLERLVSEEKAKEENARQMSNSILLC